MWNSGMYLLMHALALVKTGLQLGRGWVITSYVCLKLLIHALTEAMLTKKNPCVLQAIYITGNAIHIAPANI